MPGAQAAQAHLDAVEPDVAVEGPRRQREVEPQVVQVPAQAGLHALALTDEVVAVVGQQAHVALGPGEARLGQAGLTQRRPRHALGVDRVALARGARRGARPWP